MTCKHQKLFAQMRKLMQKDGISPKDYMLMLMLEASDVAISNTDNILEAVYILNRQFHDMCGRVGMYETCDAHENCDEEECE